MTKTYKILGSFPDDTAVQAFTSWLQQQGGEAVQSFQRIRVPFGTQQHFVMVVAATALQDDVLVNLGPTVMEIKAREEFSSTPTVNVTLQGA